MLYGCLPSRQTRLHPSASETLSYSRYPMQSGEEQNKSVVRDWDARHLPQLAGRAGTTARPEAPSV